MVSTTTTNFNLIPMSHQYVMQKHPSRDEFDEYINKSPVEILGKETTEQVYNVSGKMYRKVNYSFKVPFSKVEYENFCTEKCLIDLLKNYCDNQRIQYGAVDDILANPKDNFDQDQPLTGAQKSVLLNYSKIWDKLLDS